MRLWKISKKCGGSPHFLEKLGQIKNEAVNYFDKMRRFSAFYRKKKSGPNKNELIL